MKYVEDYLRKLDEDYARQARPSMNGERPLSDRIAAKIAQMEYDLEALQRLQALIENNPAAVEVVLAGLQALEQR